MCWLIASLLGFNILLELSVIFKSRWYTSLSMFPSGLHLGTLTGIHPPLWLSHCQDMEDLLYLFGKNFNKAKFKICMIECMCALGNCRLLCLLSALTIPAHLLFSSSPSHQPPQDWMLLLVIAAMVVVDLVFIVIATAVDSPGFMLKSKGFRYIFPSSSITRQ